MTASSPCRRWSVSVEKPVNEIESEELWRPDGRRVDDAYSPERFGRWNGLPGGHRPGAFGGNWTCASFPAKPPLLLRSADNAARNRLLKVPVLIRGHRKETLAFVGFRHITGIVGWESGAKAQYAHGLVKAGYSLDEIAQTIGDKTRDIARWVRTQSLLEQAHEQGLQEDDASKKFYFSYLLTATDAPATKRWLELKDDEHRGVVTSVNSDRLERLWLWLYGSKSQETPPVVPESRQIHKLNRVIASPRGVQELISTGNLDRALVETKDRGEYVIETLSSIRSLLQDLAAVLTGQDKLAESLADAAKVRAAKQEFQRVEKSLSDVKEKLGF